MKSIERVRQRNDYLYKTLPIDDQDEIAMLEASIGDPVLSDAGRRTTLERIAFLKTLIGA